MADGMSVSTELFQICPTWAWWCGQSLETFTSPTLMPCQTGLREGHKILLLLGPPA